MESDVGRPCFLLNLPQAAACHSVQEAGPRPVVLVPLTAQGEGFNQGWEERSRRTLAQAREAAGGAELCALLFAGDFSMEPYGELPFAQGVGQYKAAAQVLAQAGADSVLIHRAKSLLQARAGVLGVREESLPVYVTLEIQGEGEGLLAGGDILSAFVVLQELGVAAFGFYSSVTGIILEALEQVAPYSRIPLITITRNLTGQLSAEETDRLFASRVRELKRLGASWQGILEAKETQLAQAAIALAQAPQANIVRTSYLEADEVWAANETQVYDLDECMEYSPPMACHRDMADEIIAMEHENYAAVCIQPETADDGHSISLNNAHLSQMPVAFLSDDEEALEAALFYYNGRAIVDSRSMIEAPRLAAIAARYGAVVL